MIRANLKFQKRIAASVLGVGTRKIWLDPTEISNISAANSRQSVRKLINDGLVIKKPVTGHSRARARAHKEAKRNGRHSGYGKRKGTANARMPTSVLWMRRLRVLRRLLAKYRDSGKIDKTLYHTLYQEAKGNTFKHKRALIEHIIKAKAEAAREKSLQEEAEARRERLRAVKVKRQQRQQAKKEALLRDD